MNGLMAQGLTLRAGRALLLDGVTVSLPGGQVTGIIGPNGAGKSSLLRILVGLAEPASGTITLDGSPLPRPGSRERARLIGYLPQAQEVHWPLTVRRTVELGRLPHLGPWRTVGEQDRAVVDTALERTAVCDLATRPVTVLSGGERARVMLARLLVGETPVVLADEPVAALDPRHQLAVMELLRREARDSGRSVGLVLHDLTLAARYCDALVLMAGGRVIEAGPTEAVLGSGALAAVYGVTFGRGVVGGGAVVTPLTAEIAP